MVSFIVGLVEGTAVDLLVVVSVYCLLCNADAGRCSSVTPYLSRVSNWIEKGPRAIADQFAATADAGETDDWFHAYTWYLIALVLGDDEAQEGIESLETAELICDEDRFLANLQIAIWFHRGIFLPVRSTYAMARLAEASFPFLLLPSMEEIGAAEDVTAFRDAAWQKALVDFGFPSVPLQDEAAANAYAGRLIRKIIELSGWGPLDYSVPLGPSVPHRPFWIHHRHVLRS
jgi:hypothetical protein